MYPGHFGLSICVLQILAISCSSMAPMKAMKAMKAAMKKAMKAPTKAMRAPMKAAPKKAMKTYIERWINLDTKGCPEVLMQVWLDTKTETIEYKVFKR